MFTYLAVQSVQDVVQLLVVNFYFLFRSTRPIPSHSLRHPPETQAFFNLSYGIGPRYFINGWSSNQSRPLAAKHADEGFDSAVV